MNESTLTRPVIPLPPVPPCPSWCEVHGQQDREWDVDPGAITRYCRATFHGAGITPPGEDDLPDVSLERFADVDENGWASVCDPVIRIDGGDALTTAQTAAQAHQMLQVVALTLADEGALDAARQRGYDAGYDDAVSIRPRRLGIVR